MTDQPTAFSASPTTANDSFPFTQSLALNGALLTLDVRANDTGTEPLWSLSSTNTLASLAPSDAPGAWEATASGNRMRIVDGKVEIDLTNALARYAGDPAGLRAGETITDSFFYTVRLADGTLSLAKSDFTITGSNDLPRITSAAQSVSFTEDGNTVTAAGALTATDADTGTVLTYSGSIRDSFGTLTVQRNGTWTYLLNAEGPAVQALAKDDLRILTYPITVSDGAGGTAVQNLTVTITGTNDAPVIRSAVTAGAVTEDGRSAAASGTITATDADRGATLTYTTTAVTTDAAKFGTMAIDANGKWAFTLANSNAEVQALKAGEVKTLTYTATVSDGIESASRTLTITVTGTNDAPRITAAQSTGSVTEDASAQITGQITVTDVDGDSLTYSATSQTRDAANFGTFTVDATGQWSFAVANASRAVQSLAEGQTKALDYLVRVSDGNGGTATQKVTIVVVGTNDAPVVNATTSTLTGALTEDARVAGASGQLVVTDADAGAKLTFAAAPNAENAKFGTFTVDAAGKWAFTVKNASPDVQALKAGETKILTYTVSAADQLGASVSRDVTITLTGAQDAAVITNTNARATVTEDATLTASGTLTVTDRDAGESGFQAPATLAGTFGTFTFATTTGAWSYALNNSSAAVQALNNGETRLDSLTVRSLDGTAHTISVTIRGVTEPVPTLAAIVTTADPLDTDTAGSTPNATATAAGDLLIGTATADVVSALGGDDTVYGRAGADLLSGGAGDDRAFGGAGADSLFGDDGADVLSGGSGNDLLSGGTGADRLTGGFGADTLIGGDGADTFVFTAVGDRADRILDFTSGTDKIDVSGIDANASSDGDQAFVWGGTTATANGLWIAAVANNITNVYGDTDGNVTTAEVWFTLVTTPITGSDFVL